MDDKRLYAAILGLKEPWGVEPEELRLAEGRVHIWVALPPEDTVGLPGVPHWSTGTDALNQRLAPELAEVIGGMARRVAQ
jgi:hypothetical protein